MIVEGHDYQPHAFSSQGTWGSSWPVGTAFDATTQAAPFTAELDTAARWSELHGYPVYVGEWGSNVAAPAASRVACASMARAALESRGLSWATWNFDADFAVYDTHAHRARSVQRRRFREPPNRCALLASRDERAQQRACPRNINPIFVGQEQGKPP